MYHTHSVLDIDPASKKFANMVSHVSEQRYEILTTFTGTCIIDTYSHANKRATLIVVDDANRPAFEYTYQELLRQTDILTYCSVQCKIHQWANQ